MGASRPGRLDAPVPQGFAPWQLSYLVLRIVLGLTLRAVAVVLGVVAAALGLILLRTRAARTILSRYVGDSFALVEEPEKFEKMVEQVTRDLRWLSKRSKRVAVVAHSQGGMIANRVLSRAPVGNLSCFIGYGSGLGPLSALETVSRDRQRLRAGWASALALILYLLVVGPALWSITTLTTQFLSAVAVMFLGAAMWLSMLPGKLMSQAYWAIGSPVYVSPELPNFAFFTILGLLAALVEMLATPTLWMAVLLGAYGRRRGRIDAVLASVRGAAVRRGHYRWVEWAATADQYPHQRH